MNTYTIHVVNKYSEAKLFWLFLSQPEISNAAGTTKAGDEVFANSKAVVNVPGNYQGDASFTIPVQYRAGAESNSTPLKYGVKVAGDEWQDTDLGELSELVYASFEPAKKCDPTQQTVPTISKPSTGTPGFVELQTNQFNRGENERCGWFSSWLFGIETAQGFTGMTRAADSNVTYQIKPILTFYVSVGAFASNTLASWTEVGNNAQQVTTDDFDASLECTVTYTATGTWEKSPGGPSKATGTMVRIVDKLLESHSALLAATSEVWTVAKASDSSRQKETGITQKDKITFVGWGVSIEDAERGVTFISGTITVAVALGAAFTAFVLAGVKFTVTKGAYGDRTVSFTYSGPLSVKALKDLLQVGKEIIFQQG